MASDRCNGRPVGVWKSEAEVGTRPGAEVGPNKRAESGDVLGQVNTSIHEAENVEGVGDKGVEVGFKLEIGEMVGVMVGHTEVVWAGSRHRRERGI
jgi:hypothetical protein